MGNTKKLVISILITVVSVAIFIVNIVYWGGNVLLHIVSIVICVYGFIKAEKAIEAMNKVPENEPDLSNTVFADLTRKKTPEEIAIKYAGITPEKIHQFKNEGLLTASRGNKPKDTKKVKKYLEQGADLECRNEDEETPLMRAAWAGNVNTINLLIDKGAQIDVANWEGKTPLMAAIIYGHADAVKALIKANADITAQCHSGHDARFYTQATNHTDLISLLE